MILNGSLRSIVIMFLNQFVCDTYLLTQTDLTPIVQNQWYLINSSNWTSDVSIRFTTNNDGEITYIGTKPIWVLAVGSVSVSRTSGGVDTIEARLAKNAGTPNTKTGGTTKKFYKNEYPC